MPVAAVTASVVEQSRDACMAAGMDEYLVKPVTAARLEAVLKSLLCIS